jgi:hypothetical protein
VILQTFQQLINNLPTFKRFPRTMREGFANVKTESPFLGDLVLFVIMESGYFSLPRPVDRPLPLLMVPRHLKFVDRGQEFGSWLSPLHFLG